MECLSSKKIIQRFLARTPTCHHFLGFYHYYSWNHGAYSEGIFHGFSLDFLGSFYTILVYAQDILHPLVLSAAVYGIIRRLSLNPNVLLVTKLT